MVPPAPRRPVTSLVGAGPWGAPIRNSGLRQTGSLLPWILPSALVHLGLIALWLLIPVTTVQPGGPLPDWFATLTPPAAAQTIVLNLPPPPAPPRALEPAVVAPAPSAPVEGPVEGPAPIGPPAPPRAAATPDQGTNLVFPPSNGPEGRGYTAAERLRPGQAEPDLWSPLPMEIVGLSEEQVAQLELDLAIAAITDSMAVLAAAGRRATDWTYTDAQGRRWGVSPGQLHLGGITIPLPFGFSAPPSDAAMRRAWQDADVAGQAGRATARAALKDRAAEIRRRRDAERARASADTTSGN